MAKPNQAIVLRVHRNVAGVSFPWDCVYFFRRSEEKLLPKIFPCSLVLVMTKRFTRLVKKAVDNPRGDAEASMAYPHHRRDEKKLAARVKRRAPIKDVMTNPADYVALIPTLHLKGTHAQGKSGPAYLTARPRAPAPRSVSAARRATQNKKKTGQVFVDKGKFISSHQIRMSILRKLVHEAMTSRAYFLFYGEKIQPVCLCCPNNLDFMDGKCIFGEEKCYKSLDQAKHSDFVEALHLYKEIVVSGNEPEVFDE